jgi:hypothetical protein
MLKVCAVVNSSLVYGSGPTISKPRFRCHYPADARVVACMRKEYSGRAAKAVGCARATT